MASSSKPKEDPTPEEIMARKRMITGGQYAGNLLDITPGTEIMMNADGSNGFSMGPDPSDRFMWNEKTGDYRSNGGGIARIAEMPQAAAPAQSAAPVGAPAPKPKDWRDDIDMTRGEGSAGSGPGLTTDGIVDNTGMQNWMAMGPQTAGEHVNALVDPSQWQYQVDPADQRVRNLGRYQNPMLDEWMNSPQYQGGLLALNKGLV